MFSLAIATCDRPESLARTLTRVAESLASAGASCPVIVADNGGNAPAADVVARFREATGIVAHCIACPPRNKCKALNMAVAAADTEWMAFTDDDTLPDVNWLAAAVSYARSCGCRVFGGRVVPGEPDGPLPGWFARDARGEWPGHGVFVRYAPRPESGILAGNARVPFGANVFVRRDVFEDHGGYDEALWVLCGRAALGVDDGEFGARLQKRGEPIGYCQEAMVTHPVHHERCRLSKQLRLAWYFGWRDALVFLDVERPRVERYQLGLVVRWASRVAASLVRANRADAFRQALKAARSAGELACRLSSSYNKRAAMLGAGMATAVPAVGQRRGKPAGTAGSR